MEKRYQNIHQDLIEKCRNGDQAAQFELYRAFYKGMYNVSLRIVGNTTDAEDVMQEAFLNAFKKIDSYRGEVSFGAWLKRIVINRSLDYLKKRRIKFDEINEKMTESIEENSDYREVDMPRINQAIKSLPHGYRVVLSLYLIEGFDHQEISQILKISHSACRTQYMRAKNKLKQLLKSEELYTYN